MEWLLLIVFLILVAAAVWMLLRRPSGTGASRSRGRGQPSPPGAGHEPAGEPAGQPQQAAGDRGGAGPYDQMSQPPTADEVAGPGAAEPAGYSEDAQTGISESGDQTPAGYDPGDRHPETVTEHTGTGGTAAHGSTGMAWSQQPDGVTGAGGGQAGVETYEPAGTDSPQGEVPAPEQVTGGARTSGADADPDEPMADSYTAATLPGMPGEAPGQAPAAAPAEAPGDEPGDEPPFGPGSAVPAPDGSGPQGWSIKGNTGSMLFHTEDSPAYQAARAEVWFQNEEAARAAGFVHWDRKRR